MGQVTNDPYVGILCQVILDGYGYFIKPGSYEVHQPRLRRVAARFDGGNSYVDLGPGKRTWRFTVLAIDGLRDYTGTPFGFTGQQWRDTLRGSYLRVDSVLSFVDLRGDTQSVRFDNLVERVGDPRSQVVGLSYELDVELVEA